MRVTSELLNKFVEPSRKISPLNAKLFFIGTETLSGNILHIHFHVKTSRGAKVVPISSCTTSRTWTEALLLFPLACAVFRKVVNWQYLQRSNHTSKLQAMVKRKKYVAGGAGPRGSFLGYCVCVRLLPSRLVGPRLLDYPGCHTYLPGAKLTIMISLPNTEY